LDNTIENFENILLFNTDIDYFYKIYKKLGPVDLDLVAIKECWKTYRYLYKKGYRCTVFAMNILAENGNLKAIKYLHKTNCDCNTYAIDLVDDRRSRNAQALIK
jgi:ribosomal protein S4E